MTLRGVLFDVHDTLVRKDRRGLDEAGRSLVAFLRDQGYTADEAGYLSAWKRTVQRFGRAATGTDEVSFHDWWRSLLGGMGISDPSIALMDLANAAWWEPFRHLTTPLPGAQETLAGLQELRLRIGAVSNSLSRNTAWDLAATGLLPYFDGLFISSDIGQRKPHPAIYAAALAGLELQASEAIMVGDSLRDDVFGPQQLGIRAALLATDPALRSRPWSDAAADEEPPAVPDWTICELRQVLDVVRSL